MLPQLVINGVVLGCEYALLAVSFGIIFKTTKTFHFAHAIIYTAAGYIAFLFFDGLSIPLAVAIGLGIAGGSLAGVIVEFFLYRPLRRVGASHESILIASLGLLTVGEMVIVLAVGDGPRTVGYHPEIYFVRNIAVTSVQLYSTAVNVLLVIIAIWFFAFSAAGKTMEAVASNSELAGLVGIRVQRVYNYAFCIGSALAGTVSCFALVDKGIDPYVGVTPATMAFIAVIMGGVESIPGWALAGFILGMTINISVFRISSEWQYLVAFLVVIGVLIVRPSGLMAKGK